MVVEMIMLVGVLIGYFAPLKKYAAFNSRLQMVCTAVLIFSMGVSLGNRENFFSELAELGLESAVYSIVPIIFSVIAVYLLTKRFMKPKDKRSHKD